MQNGLVGLFANYMLSSPTAQQFLAVQLWSKLPFVQWRMTFFSSSSSCSISPLAKGGGSEFLVSLDDMLTRLDATPTVVFAIYIDSFLFVFATGILQFGYGVDHSMSVCESAILLCLVCYVTTKVCFPWSMLWTDGRGGMSIANVVICEQIVRSPYHRMPAPVVR